jgi:hypothetical protein
MGNCFTISSPSTSAITRPVTGSVSVPSYVHTAGLSFGLFEPHLERRKFAIASAENGPPTLCEYCANVEDIICGLLGNEEEDAEAAIVSRINVTINVVLIVSN